MRKVSKKSRVAGSRWCIFYYICTVITKKQIKTIRSLSTSKGRKKTGWFMAEGPKIVGDLLNEGFNPMAIFDDVEDVNRISNLQHPQGVVGIFDIPDFGEEANSIDPKALTIVLDGIQDPGNLGTIIRVADWFGVNTICCSPDTVDCWSPKVVQATMGSIARVHIYYAPLVQSLSSLPADCPVYVTELEGDSIYEAPLKPQGVIVMGNEGKGVTQQVRKLATRHLLIPNYPKGKATAESLNVAIATALTLGEFRRRML